MVEFQRSQKGESQFRVDCGRFGPLGRKSQMEISSKDGASSFVVMKSLKFKLKGGKGSKSSQALVQAQESGEFEELDEEDEEEKEVKIISLL